MSLDSGHGPEAGFMDCGHSAGAGFCLWTVGTCT